MTSPNKRRLKKKFVKTATKTIVRYERHKKGKAICPVCRKKMRGTACQSKIHKYGKSERKISTVLPMLCNGCRSEVFGIALMIKVGLKDLDKTKMHLRKYTEQALEKIEGAEL